MKRLPIWCLCPVLAIILLLNARIDAQAPANASVSERIDAIFKDLAGREYPGAVVVVLRDGRVVHSRAYGLANVELGVPNTTRTRFRLASVTKTFTALAVLRLVEQGRLRLDDPLATYVPDFAGGDRITIRHLLTHTAGLPDFIPFAEARKQPPENPPGAHLNYSNIGYMALGKVLTAITGKPFEEHLRETMFAPLGMADTMVGRRQSIQKNRASGYVGSPQGALLNAEYGDPGNEPEAGGLCSTAEDMTVWMQALLAGKIVSQDTFRQATTRVRLNDGREGAYGYGWMLQTFRGLREVAHGGDIDGFNSYVSIYPEERLAVIVLSNLGMYSAGVIPTAGDIAHRILAIAATKPLGPEWPPVVPVASSLLDRYVGRFRIEAPPMITSVMGDTIEFVREGDRLVAIGKQGRAEVFAETTTTFYVKGAPATFTFVSRGDAPADAVVTLYGVREYRLSRLQ